MSRQSEAVRPSASAVRRAVDAVPYGAWLLAVSGGRDSMSLLDAFASSGRRDIRAVATVDHGTGSVARRAAMFVERRCAAIGLPFVGARIATPAARPTEASWREARWRFLGGWARELGAVVVTAHTRDDQAETVALRILRGAGARGLAAMARESPGPPPVIRPFIGVGRADVEAYARDASVAFVDDPSNLDLRHARNRMRHELLPAFERARPGFHSWLLELGARARAWRGGVEALVDRLTAEGVVMRQGEGSLVVRTAPFAALGPGEWRVLWPAFAARAGLALDRSGVARAADWAALVAGDASARGRIPLAGGGELERTRGAFVLRRVAAPGPRPGTP